jgi:hypothetical protein
VNMKYLKKGFRNSIYYGKLFFLIWILILFEQCYNESQELYKVEKLKLPDYSFQCKNRKENIKYSVYYDTAKNFHIYEGKIWCKESEVRIKSKFNCEGECVEYLEVIYDSRTIRLFEIHGNKLGGGIRNIELSSNKHLTWIQNFPELVVSFNECMLDFETGIVRCEKP